jgi:hypothetical protein
VKKKLATSSPRGNGGTSRKKITGKALTAMALFSSFWKIVILTASTMPLGSHGSGQKRDETMQGTLPYIPSVKNAFTAFLSVHSQPQRIQEIF